MEEPLSKNKLTYNNNNNKIETELFQQLKKCFIISHFFSKIVQFRSTSTQNGIERITLHGEREIDFQIVRFFRVVSCAKRGL